MSSATEQTHRPNRAERIFDDLVRRIIGGDVEAGNRLPPERELAVHYDTNRNTLREALRRLEQARLVTVRQGRGVTVANWRQSGTIEILGAVLAHLTDDVERLRALIDLLELRRNVLEMAVGLATERGSDDELERIEQLSEAEIDAFLRKDRDQLVERDMRLLNGFVDASRSLTLTLLKNSVLDVYRQLLEPVKLLWVFDPDFPAFFRRRIEAMKRRDSREAVRLTRAFYKRSDEAVLEMVRHLWPAAALPNYTSEGDHE